MAKLTAPNTRIDWYPEGHFSNPLHPTVIELNTGYNLSPAIVEGSEVDYVDPTTEDTTTIYDMFSSEGIRANNYEANIQYLLNAKDAVLPVVERDQAEALFYNTQTPVGYIGKRFGYPWHVAYDDIGTIYTTDIFKVQADLPKLQLDNGGMVLLDIRYIPQGEAFRVHLVNYITYDDMQRLWVNSTYSQVQDVYSGRTYNNIIESY